MNNKTKRLVITAMLSAVSVCVLMIPFLRMPLLPAAPFLEYDAMDVPILIGSLLYGPLTGLIITAISSLIQGLTVSSASSYYGIIMHIIATGAFVLTASLIYGRSKKTNTSLMLALALGTLAMAAVMVPANLLVTPLFLGTPREAVVAMILPIIIPFNLLKAGINSVVVFLLFPQIKKAVIKNK